MKDVCKIRGFISVTPSNMPWREIKPHYLLSQNNYTFFSIFRFILRSCMVVAILRLFKSLQEENIFLKMYNCINIYNYIQIWKVRYFWIFLYWIMLNNNLWLKKIYKKYSGRSEEWLLNISLTKNNRVLNTFYSISKYSNNN